MDKMYSIKSANSIYLIICNLLSPIFNPDVYIITFNQLKQFYLSKDLILMICMLSYRDKSD